MLQFVPHTKTTTANLQQVTNDSYESDFIFFLSLSTNLVLPTLSLTSESIAIHDTSVVEEEFWVGEESHSLATFS